MPGVRRVLPMIAALAVGIGVAGCGSGSNDTTSTVPASIAGPMVDTLTDAQTAADSDDCDTLKTDADTFIGQVNAIGADAVDPAVKKKLQEAGANLKDLASSQCVPPDTGSSGDSGAVEEPKTPAVAEVPDPTTDTSTTDAATEKSKLRKKAKAKAQGDAEKATKAKPNPPATPVKPTTPAKSAKDDKPAKKHGKGPKHNGPPGPNGNPNHANPGNGSGGVALPGGN